MKNEQTFNFLNENKNRMDMYAEGNDYINHYRYYSVLFDTIPNRLKVDDIDLTKFLNYLQNNFENEISISNYSLEYDFEKKKINKDDYYIVLKNNMVINLWNDCVYLLFSDELLNYSTEFLKNVTPFKIREKKEKTTNISLIIKGNYGLETRELKLKKPKLNIETHYNDDFKPINETILKEIKKSKTQGLYLFYGLPGTGKSTYIKHLIQQQRKQVIFVPPNMAGNLDNMELTEFLLDNPNCILVIEDAEDLISSRENTYNSRLSFLLNITDGILSESLGIQIIATFNTDLKNIDKALLRKGRLTAIYEFKELHTDKANVLLEKLECNYITEKPMILTDIYNFNIENNYKVNNSKTLGFNKNR